MSQDIIKVRAWQVSPSELESTLLSHLSIVDAAVVGVDLEDGRGELPRAYVVFLDETASGTLDSKGIIVDDIHRHMSKSLARYKMLSGGVVFVESIPKSASGKILKSVLRERAMGEIEKERVRAQERVWQEVDQAVPMSKEVGGTIVEQLSNHGAIG